MYIVDQSPQCNFPSMVAGWIQCIFIIHNTGLLLPLSMCSNIFCFADLLIYSHKKELSGQQQHQLKSSWPLSGLPWHTKHRRLLVVEYVAVFLTCKRRLVYCMYFTAMEHCYSYRELKTRYYWSNWQPIYSVYLVSLGHETSGLELIIFEVGLCLAAIAYFLILPGFIMGILS